MSEQFEPKDYRLAKRAYEAFHEEHPQVWFDQLSHAYQMRWVRAVRAAKDELKRLGGRPRGPSPSPSSPLALALSRSRSSPFSSIENAQSFLDSFPRLKGGRFIDREGLSPTDLGLIRRAQKYVSNARTRQHDNHSKNRRGPKKAE